MSELVYHVTLGTAAVGLALYLYFFKVRKDIWGP